MEMGGVGRVGDRIRASEYAFEAPECVSSVQVLPPGAVVTTGLEQGEESLRMRIVRADALEVHVRRKKAIRGPSGDLIGKIVARVQLHHDAPLYQLGTNPPRDCDFRDERLPRPVNQPKRPLRHSGLLEQLTRPVRLVEMSRLRRFACPG